MNSFLFVGLTEPVIKTQGQIEGIREACKIARKVLHRAGESVKVCKFVGVIRPEGCGNTMPGLSHFPEDK